MYVLIDDELQFSFMNSFSLTCKSPIQESVINVKVLGTQVMMMMIAMEKSIKIRLSE